MIDESGINFRQTFLFVFYKALRPILDLTEPSVEWVYVCVYGGGSYFTSVLSHTRQGDD